MNLLSGLIPPSPPSDIVRWAEEHVRFPGSVRSELFRASITPWLVEPLRCITDPVVRKITFVKPIQTGGTRLGLIAICWWSKFGHGKIQYNWSKDEQAEKKWMEETLPTVRACDEAKIQGDVIKCRCWFPSSFLHVQGVWVPENLDSDSIPYQVNEEIHAWKPGHLAKARGRQTAVAFPKALDISNAGDEGDQLHQSLQEGTDQRWEVKCPGCGKYHEMHTRWDEAAPELGGLRYDASKARKDGGRYDYNKLAPTIRYQMPCGFEVRDEQRARKQLSLSGRWSTPRNSGALQKTALDGTVVYPHRSFSMDAVSVDFIEWLTLIQEKHIAIRAMNLGDPDPYMRYVKEREDRFWKRDDSPLIQAVVLSSDSKSDRLPNRVKTLAFFDRQAGSESGGVEAHWWGLLCDVTEDATVLPVWDGKIEGADANEKVVRLCKEFELDPWDVSCDSGDDTPAVYRFCMENGYNATKGEELRWWTHSDGAKRRYSEETNDYLFSRASHETFIQRKPNESDDDYAARLMAFEPRYILFARDAFYDRLAWMIKEGKWRHPADASPQYRAQMVSWQIKQFEHPRTNEKYGKWVQITTHDHLWQCAAGIVLAMERAGFIGQKAVEDNESET